MNGPFQVELNDINNMRAHKRTFVVSPAARLALAMVGAMRAHVFALSALFLLPGVLGAQVPARHVRAAGVASLYPDQPSSATSSAIAASSATDSSQPWIGWPIIAGLGLGTAGWFVGALLALEIEKDCGEDLCVLDEVIFLGAATGTTGLALGVHLGNGRRGNFALDLLTASGVWATGFVLFVASDNQDLAIPLAVLVPIGQLAATTAVERAKGRAKERQRVGVFMAPQRDGRIALGASVSF